MKLREKLTFNTTFEKGLLKQTPYSLMKLSRYEPTKVSVTIEPIRSARSLNQLAYLYGVVYQTIAEHTGHSPTELHEIYKLMFLPPRITKYRGREIKLPPSTSRLSKGEMAEFITRIIADAGELGISIEPADPTKSTQRLDA